ncbi:MAG: glycosyltransferase family 39 protein [Candidatus Omnitrophica bacterium]|nr:glycosyltransferase family 39 protein [Candidatus Omnitrophota bacterium]
MILLGIIFTGCVFRFSFPGAIPNGLFCDEAARGYDAYSILNTLRDHNGDFLPLFTRAFGEFPPSTYTFLAVPAVAIFGLNEFAVRLPAAVAGVLTILAAYWLVKECFNRKTALVAALFLAVSPWHIQFSRTAFECILFPLCFVSGVLFFVKAFKREPNYLILSALMFGVSLHTYFAARVFVPLFMTGLVVIFREFLWEHRKRSLISFIVFMSIFTVLLVFWLSPGGTSRAQAVGLTFDLKRIFLNYLKYFSPSYLFLSGDANLRHSILNTGQLHFLGLWTIPAGIAGVVLGLKKKTHRIFLLWLILYPIPAALTTEGAPHAIRSIIGAPLFPVFSAVGCFVLLGLFRRRIAKAIFISGISLIFLFNVAGYAKSYFYDYPKYSTGWWQHGMREAVEYAENSRYKNVILSDKFNQGYIFLLFYAEYLPSRYQLGLKQGGKYSFGKYRVGSIERPIKVDTPVLFILRPDEMKKIPKGYEGRVVHVVRDPRGYAEMVLVEIRA